MTKREIGILIIAVLCMNASPLWQAIRVSAPLIGKGITGDELRIDTSGSSPIATKYSIRSGSIVSGIDNVLAVGQNFAANRKIQVDSYFIDIGDPDINSGGDYIHISPGTGYNYIDNPGHIALFGINTTTPSVALDVVGDAQISGDTYTNGKLIISTHTPSSSGDTGVAGTIAWDGSYFYVCTATNTWTRIALTW